MVYDVVKLTTSYTIVEGVIQRVKAMRKDEEFKVLFLKAKGNSEAAGIEVPDEIPGQARRRKVPQKYKYSTKSATEDYQAQDLEEHYRGKVFFTFLDTLSQELHRRFKGKDETPTGLILSGLHCLTIPSHWKGMTDNGVARSVKDVCRFYDVEEENVVTELKVFHSSYALPPSNVKAVLKCLKDNDVQSVFPGLTLLLKTYATIPVTTASVERSFSKLKLIKTQLRNRCGESRLSDLLLLSIERDIPIDYNEVIDIYKHMAKRRILL